MISHPRGHHRGPDDRRYHRHNDVHQGATRGPPGRSAGGTTTRIPLRVLGLPFFSISVVDVLVRTVPTSVGRRRVGGSIVIVSAIGGSGGTRTRRRGAGRGRAGRSIDGSGGLRKQPAVAVAAIGSDSDGGEGDSGGASTAAAVGTAAAEAGRMQPWRQRRRFGTMEAAKGGGGRRAAEGATMEWMCLMFDLMCGSDFP